MRILLIEDNPGDSYLVSKALQSNSTTHDIETSVRLCDALSRDLESFDVVLADLTLPDSTGLNGLQELKNRCPDLPVIVLTSLDNNSLALEAIKQGAQDYIVKDHCDRETLDRAIRHAVERQRMATENARLLQEIQDSKALLEQKNRRLQQLCDTAQQFVDNVSHEFRTPLTVIMEYASLINDGIAGEVTEKQSELLHIIDDRACDLNTMVDDMLDVSKLESGLLGASRQSCSTTSIVDHVLPALQRKALVRGVVLHTQVSPTLPRVFCDDEKIGRVIVNLAVNAIKFARDPGEVTIWAEVRGDDEVLVGVTDNGPGISPDKRAEIFDRFSQVHTELRQSTKGFGLGLGIAKELVDLNFGRMQVESELGVGSTFSFTVPIADTVTVAEKYSAWLQSSENALPTVSAVSVEVVAPSTDTSSAHIEAFLHGVLRQQDLMFRKQDGEWLLIINTPPLELNQFRERLFQEHAEVNRNRPKQKLPSLNWRFRTAWQVGDTREITEFIGSQFRQEFCCV